MPLPRKIFKQNCSTWWSSAWCPSAITFWRKLITGLIIAKLYSAKNVLASSTVTPLGLPLQYLGTFICTTELGISNIFAKSLLQILHLVLMFCPLMPCSTWTAFIPQASSFLKRQKKMQQKPLNRFHQKKAIITLLWSH